MDYFLWPLLIILVVIIAMRALGTSRFSVVAMAHDALPVVLSLAWLIALISAVTSRWTMLVFALALIIVQMQMIIPRLRPNAVPDWALSDPSISILCANVFVDNETPDEFAAMLIENDPDVIVIVERNPAFMQAFQRAGGEDKYPFFVDDPDDDSEYAVAIRSRLELQADSGPVDAGNVNIARAIVTCGTRQLNILGVNPYATIDRGGYAKWRTQMRELARFVRTLPRPTVVVGDINASQYRPGFERFLRATDLTDVHDAAGKGLTHSLKLSARGLLGVLPAVARLDHALVSDGVHATNIMSLPMLGSDHRPFFADYIVRQKAGARRQRAERSRSSKARRALGKREDDSQRNEQQHGAEISPAQGRLYECHSG